MSREKVIEEIQNELKTWEKAAVMRAKGMTKKEAPGILRVIFHSLNERLEDMKAEKKDDPLTGEFIKEGQYHHRRSKNTGE